jgi:hypothetical protein
MTAWVYLQHVVERWRYGGRLSPINLLAFTLLFETTLDRVAFCNDDGSRTRV